MNILFHAGSPRDLRVTRNGPVGGPDVEAYEVYFTAFAQQS